MTNPEINQAIAELCDMPVADFCTDAKAMAEANQCASRNLMDGDQWERYGHELENRHWAASIRKTDGSPDYYDLATLITELTVYDQAVAFVRTMGRWRD